jgi:5-methylcytosine-specific restriction endonuclease McrA
MSRRISRFPALKKVDGKIVCRGCGGEIPKGRRTWCSRECNRKFDPFWVREAVWERDAGKCQKCSLQLRKKAPWSQDWQEYGKLRAAWRKVRPEYDHIVPFSEGGATVLENMRLLCRVCHVKVTAEWRRKKAK